MPAPAFSHFHQVYILHHMMSLVTLTEGSSPPTPYDNQWFGLEAAIAQSEETRYVLWETGCQKIGGLEWNCTAACLDTDTGPYQLWGGSEDPTTGMSTLTNCLVLPYIIRGLEDGTIADPDQLAKKYNISPSNDTELAYNATKGYPVIEACLNTYCEQNSCTGFAILNDATCRLSNYTVCGAPQWHYVNLCGVADRTVNSDVGGIGVIVSYIMQSSILLTAYLVQSTTKSWIKWASIPVYTAQTASKSGQWSAKIDVAEAYDRASCLQSRLTKKYRLDSHAAPLVAALVDFQKTQVFFMLTVEVAVIVALCNAPYINAGSWDQLWTNLDFMHTVGFQGVDPVVFGAVLLRKGQKVSWYISMASICCVMVSSITVFQSLRVHWQPNQLKDDYGPSRYFDHACGGRDPHRYCMGDHQSFGPMNKVTAAIVVAWAVSPAIMLFILAEKLGPIWNRLGSLVARQAMRRTYQWCPLPASSIYHGVTSRLSRRIASIFAEVWLVWRLCYAIAYYVGQLPNALSSESTVGVRWALGQIIAVAVWIPAIIEYLYLLFHGIEKGSLYRLVRPYHVSSFPPSSPANTSAQGTPLATLPASQQLSSPSPASSIPNFITQSIPPGTPPIAHQVSTGSLSSSALEPLLVPQISHAGTWSPG